MNTIVNPQAVRKYMADNNLTEKEFCKECNISFGSLQKILSLDQEVSLLHFMRVRYLLRIKGYLR